MRRAIGAVLCLLAPAAWGQTTLDYSVTHVGTYTPAGLITPVSVYDLTFAVFPGDLGAIVLDVGADYMGYGGNPFQVGIQGKGYVDTPTVYDANDVLATETFAWQTDSHFMIPRDWMPAVTFPTEMNDGSLGTYVDPYGQTEVRGLGGLTVITAVPVVNRVPGMDIARIGIPAETVVYMRGQIVRYRDIEGGGYDVEVRRLEDVQLPMLYQNTWQGSGTGGLTSTDPNDPTVQWDHLGNWSRGVRPGLGDGVRVEMTNPGRVIAASGTVGSVWMGGAPAGGTFDIPAGTELGITGSLIVGMGGTAASTQGGNAHCTVFALGEEVGSYGAYQLNEGRLAVDLNAYVGKSGGGVFTQTAGTMQAGRSLLLGRFAHGQGTYRLQGGCVAAGSVQLYNQSLFHQAGGSIATESVFVNTTSTFLLEDGEVQAPQIAVRGTFIQTGGRNIASDRLSVSWYQGGARYEMRGGVLNADTIHVAWEYNPRFSRVPSVLELLGGTVNANSVYLDGNVVQEGGLLNVSDIQIRYFPGTFQLRGGEVRTDLLSTGGTFEQKGGLLYAGQIDLSKIRPFELDGGQIVAGLENVYGTFTQTGGINTVTDTLAISTVPADHAVYELLGGALSAANITGHVSVLGGAISVQTMGGTLVNDGGVIAPGSSIGMMSLGGLVQNSGTLQIELAALDNFDKVWIANSAKLGGVLDLRSMSDYRPREGDSFPIITVTSWHPGTPYYQGDFAAITSDITTGLGGGAAFGGRADGQDYRVTFLGCTNGDANGDHIVDGGDLALVGRNWIQAGKGWADADFNGNGQVEGGDLALLQGNWTWELPAAPPPGVPLPEPAAGCLIGLGAMVLLARRRGATARRMGDA